MLTNEEEDKIICQNKVIQNVNYTCQFCYKTMYNSACKRRHLLLSRDDCTRTMLCDKCNKLYLK